jgi:hypothetical protein
VYENQGNDFADVFNGSWAAVAKYLAEQLPERLPEPNRFLQDGISPMSDGHRGHACYVTNRVELPAHVRSGVTPLVYAADRPRRLGHECHP